jgi:hypothetical protein
MSAALAHPTRAADDAPVAQIPSGTLAAMGVLFMTSTPYSSWDPAKSRQQYILPLVQRDGRGHMTVVALWAGPDAESFMRLHTGLLKPGRALTVTFRRIFALNNQIHGLVQCASLAPDRWERQQPAESANNPTPATA